MKFNNKKPTPQSKYKYRWIPEVWTWGIGLTHQYKSPDHKGWHHSPGHYSIFLTKNWRRSDLGYKEEYYDGTWCCYHIPFIAFTWFK